LPARLQHDHHRSPLVFAHVPISGEGIIIGCQAKIIALVNLTHVEHLRLISALGGVTESDLTALGRWEKEENYILNCTFPSCRSALEAMDLGVARAAFSKLRDLR